MTRPAARLAARPWARTVTALFRPLPQVCALAAALAAYAVVVPALVTRFSFPAAAWVAGPADSGLTTRTAIAVSIVPVLTAWVLGAGAGLWLARLPERVRRWRRTRALASRLLLSLDSLRLEAQARASEPYGRRLAQRVEALADGVDAVRSAGADPLDDTTRSAPRWRDLRRAERSYPLWQLLDEQAASLWRAVMILDAEPGWPQAWQAECLPLQRLAATTDLEEADRAGNLALLSQALEAGRTSPAQALEELDERARRLAVGIKQDRRRTRAPRRRPSSSELPHGRRARGQYASYAELHAEHAVRGPAAARGMHPVGSADVAGHLASVLVRERALTQDRTRGSVPSWLSARGPQVLSAAGAAGMLLLLITLGLAQSLLAPRVTLTDVHVTDQEPVTVCVADPQQALDAQTRESVVQALSTARYGPDVSVLVVVVPPLPGWVQDDGTYVQSFLDQWPTMVGGPSVRAACPTFFTSGSHGLRKGSLVLAVSAPEAAAWARDIVLAAGEDTTGPGATPGADLPRAQDRLKAGTSTLAHEALAVTEQSAQATGTVRRFTYATGWADGLGEVLLPIGLAAGYLVVALAGLWRSRRSDP